MTIDEAERLHLYQVARDRWADDGAARTLMNLLPPDRDELASKNDVQGLGLGLRQEMADVRGDLRQEMADVRGDLRQEMADLRGDLRQEMADLRGDLRQEMADLRGDLHQEMADLRGDLRQEMAELRGDFRSGQEALRSDLIGRMHTTFIATVGMWITLVALLVAARFG